MKGKGDMLERVLETGMFVSFLILVGVVMLSVTTRFFLPFVVFSWTEETSRFLFLWMVALGAPCALKRGEFVSVDFLMGRFPQRFRKWFQSVFYGITGGFFTVVFFFSLQFARLGFLQMSPTMRIPMVFAYLSMVVTSFLIALYAFVLLFQRGDAR
ncbi:MAG: TRAP transporter small permease subunit [Atribacterota bacterium]